MPSCSTAGGITSTSAGRMSKAKWVTRSSADSSIPTISFSSLEVRCVRTPRLKEPILREKSPMPTCDSLPRRRAAPELHDVDMRTLHGLMQSLEAV